MASKEESLAQFVESEKLISSNTLNFIEGWTDASNQLHTRRGNVAHERLYDFLAGHHDFDLEKEPPRSYRFRVLSIPRLENGRLKIGVPRHTFQEIKRAWNLHDFTLEAFLNNNGIVSSFDTQEKKCILMKMAASRAVGFDTISVSHDKQQNITNVLYYSLEDEAGIFNSLLAEPQRCLQPAFFATVLYRCHQQRVERFRNRVDDEITAVERGSKFGGPGRLFGHRYKHEEPTVKVDSDAMTKKLSFVQTELAVVRHLARSSLKCGEWLVKLAEKDHAKWERSNSIGFGKTETIGLGNSTVNNTMKTLDEAEYVKRRAETVCSQLESVRDRVQSQTTFLLNTAAQTQSDFTANIALETRRDSAAMKTIAIMTILFLPGTFVATLFSMNMFEWQPEDGGKAKVSGFFWVYWIISVPLTLLVMVSWLLWSRRDVRLRHVKTLREIE